MKMKWNKGINDPVKSGYYLAWNAWEDDYPVVLHFSDDVGFCQWTYTTHRSVVYEQISAIYTYIFSDFFSVFREMASKKEIEIIDKMEEAFEQYIEKSDGDEQWPIISIADDFTNSEKILSYDTDRPAYWAELPYLWDMDNSLSDELVVNYDPNILDIEIQDAKASAINSIVSNIEMALNKEMTRFASPWEEQKAPWSKS